MLKSVSLKRNKLMLPVNNKFDNYINSVWTFLFKLHL